MTKEPTVRHPAYSERLESVQVMRGIAACMVMLYHLAVENESFRVVFPSFGTLVDYCDPGVWMFFAISGFVIPHAMQATDYRVVCGAWPFFVRRLIRLEPPYIASVLLAFLITYIAARTPGFRGQPYAPSLKDFLLQFLYLAPWFNVPWINNVTWSLAIEFQYYLLMLFAAPLLLSKRVLPKAIFFIGIIASSLIVNDPRALFIYLPCFAVGFVVFLFYNKRIGVVSFFALLILFVGLAEFSNGIRAVVAVTISAGLMLVPINRPIPLLSFLGTISYSLYLIHGPIGGPILHLAMRISSHWMQFAGFVAAIVASLSAATAMWYVIERPAQLRAKTFFMGVARKPHDVLAPAVGDLSQLSGNRRTDR
jgi:peptidoglycan/LPS O-acetylase OafA/YrhL